MKLVWDLTNKCNLRCKHCGAISLINSNEETNENWKKVILYTRKFVNSVVLLGGEPLLHPKIKEIVEYINLNKMSVSIISNGQVDKEILYNIMQYSIENIFISIDGLKNTNDEIRGNGTWKTAMSSLDYLIELNKMKTNKTTLGINMVANLLNYSEIINFIDSTRFRNIVYQITPLSLEGNAKNNKNMLEIDSNELLNLYEKIAMYQMKNKDVQIYLQADYPIIFDYLNRKFGINYSIDDMKCEAFTESIYADPCGNIYPCRKYDKVKVDVNDNTNWERDFFKFKPFLELIHNNNNNNNVCNICKFNEKCILCPLENEQKMPKICNNTIERLKKLTIPLNTEFCLNKPYNIIKSEERYEIFYPNLGLQTEYSIEGIKILESIEEFKGLDEISREVSLPVDIVYEFLLQEKEANKVIEKRN